MSYTVQLSGPAQRDLANTVPPDVVARFVEWRAALQERPYRIGHRLDPPLEGLWSARLAIEHRVVYEILEHSSTVVVHAVRHRRHAYRPPGGAKRRPGKR